MPKPIYLGSARQADLPPQPLKQAPPPRSNPSSFLRTRPVRHIFLDMDGVVVLGGIVVERKLRELQRITEATHATVVLSSEWRVRRDYKAQALSLFERYGIGYVGDTPIVGDRSNRPLEITGWLDEGHQCESWVAIDDRDLLTEQGGWALAGRFVHTIKTVGLTAQLADQAIAILKNPPSLPEEPLTPLTPTRTRDSSRAGRTPTKRRNIIPSQPSQPSQPLTARDASPASGRLSSRRNSV